MVWTWNNCFNDREVRGMAMLFVTDTQACGFKRKYNSGLQATISDY